MDIAFAKNLIAKSMATIFGFLNIFAWVRLVLRAFLYPEYQVTFYTKAGHVIKKRGFNRFDYTETSDGYTKLSWSHVQSGIAALTIPPLSNIEYIEFKHVGWTFTKPVPKK